MYMFDLISSMYEFGVIVVKGGEHELEVLKLLNELHISIVYNKKQYTNVIVLTTKRDSTSYDHANIQSGSDELIQAEYKNHIVVDVFFIRFISKFNCYGIPDNLGIDGFSYECSMPFNGYESPFSNDKDIIFLQRTLEGDLLKDIDLNIEKQKKIAIDMHKKINEYSDFLNGVHRYRIKNGWFEGCDAMALWYMINKYHPKRIIEIGSGYSTAIMLDIIEQMNYDIRITCIEPFPIRLKELLKKEDKTRITLIEDYVQNVTLDLFNELEENDILFIDSSHVIKTGGDIPYEYFRILPILKKGVFIHIHDMLYPFTYPERWIKEGRPYNEAYLVRALLSGNDVYKIYYFGDMIAKCELIDFDVSEYEMCPDIIGKGASLWLRKQKL
ncbi:class I SAM-dependent methyltransferase [Butyrivibrio sp. AE3003]|uniref:class I SAM-dependent methyltransferase n=1 Tax=Butyrivibrio sp. AE3003 TaxID=1496721 RepID=UPI00068B0FEA|nr:class I SAM-dependent methyltransferase [Butyrivibrio sp. AE3003]